MPRVIHAPEHARFYDRNGVVILETPSADGKKMVKPTIAHARKLHWFPSFSNINNDVSKPHLVAWKIERAMRTMLATDRDAFENDDDFIKRCHSESNEANGLYAERGSEIHAQLHEWFESKTKPPDPACEHAANQVVEWLEGLGVEDVKCEQSFVSEEFGYAGTADIHSTGTVKILADYKSTDLSKYKKPYIDNGIQLVCYRTGLKLDHDTRLFTIPIDRDSGECKFIEWTDKSEWTHDQLWTAWQGMYSRWCVERKYDPRKLDFGGSNGDRERK